MQIPNVTKPLISITPTAPQWPPSIITQNTRRESCIKNCVKLPCLPLLSNQGGMAIELRLKSFRICAFNRKVLEPFTVLSSVSIRIERSCVLYITKQQSKLQFHYTLPDRFSSQQNISLFGPKSSMICTNKLDIRCHSHAVYLHEEKYFPSTIPCHWISCQFSFSASQNSLPCHRLEKRSSQGLNRSQITSWQCILIWCCFPCNVLRNWSQCKNFNLSLLDSCSSCLLHGPRDRTWQECFNIIIRISMGETWASETCQRKRNPERFRKEPRHDFFQNHARSQQATVLDLWTFHVNQERTKQLILRVHHMPWNPIAIQQQ